jgi:hypothetical protein
LRSRSNAAACVDALKADISTMLEVFSTTCHQTAIIAIAARS